MTQTIGEQLKQARLDKKLTIKNASQATALRAQFLEALEADDFESLPSPVQARGFLRIYAEYLGLDANPLLVIMRGGNLSEKEAATQEKLNGFENIESTNLEVGSNQEKVVEETTIEETDKLYSDPNFQGLPFSNSLPDELEPAPDITNQPLPLSQSIFVEVGQQLKGRRELLSLTLDEIEQHTRIRKNYLMALEVGSIDDLPSPVQARGILSSYSRFLDLDVDAILLRYAEGLQASRLERHPTRQKRKKQSVENDSILPPALRRILTTDLIVGGGMIVAMIVFAVWGANRIITQKEQGNGNSNSQQSISAALLAATSVTTQAPEALTPSLEITISPAVENATPTVLELPAIVNSSPIQVTTIITGETWIRIIVDGKVKFQGRAIAGSVNTYDGVESVNVLAADGSLVKIIYNQTDLGPMGDSGVITEFIYTPKGALLPTPTRTPVPTRTPRPTRTLIPSRTPTLGNIFVP
jgi:cytoskeleton protein RodZ